jgi:hypothetical protein
MLLTGMARRRIGGFLGMVPLGLSVGPGEMGDGHYKFDHDDYPGE